ncbi:MAG TPA: PDDEXK nuclease domain-containing protein [Bacteroidales bacterium]|nr:PDDEXK nuclease domain-containing protein [Bacteroidales bacterium]HOH22537.1 PDDEXK nuclease domain-containing protein [Bacteroidales bacterium]HPB57881.1 PDDEXK nuclease domain-containing protein [Bacteroidales bacterium]HPZ02959.1 PDDEXK nuclease domain-containing protein [Bacteroidales bacterium]HQB75363.1 PDDEXK nuclease domain-containing protein [Bacteroidales bacterium]
MEIAKTENNFYAEISDLLKQSRNRAYKAVNTLMVRTYWQIGKRIVEQELQGKSKANYGDYLITNLSRHLTDTFGKGFSEANLWNMRQFYQTFPDFNQFSTHCVENLSWTNIRQIMRLDNKAERDYYIKEASEQNWSSRLLERNIKSGYYRRLLSSQQPVETETDKQNPADFIKDPYVTEFLNVPKNLTGKESLLEGALISNLKQFLLELGKGFSLVDRQMRISTETSHFYIDLVFYNYLLKCFVIIDLKTRKLSHADIGQMDMYVRMFDALKRGEDDNPTLGIILCTEKDETVVKYSILKENKQLFASKYKTVLPTEEELAEMITIQQQKQQPLKLDNPIKPEQSS